MACVAAASDVRIFLRPNDRGCGTAGVSVAASVQLFLQPTDEKDLAWHVLLYRLACGENFTQPIEGMAIACVKEY